SVLLEQRVENRPQGHDVSIGGMMADRVDGLVEEGDDEPSFGPRLGEVVVEPVPLHTLSGGERAVLGVDRDEVDVPPLEGVVELVSGGDRLGHPLLVETLGANVMVAAGRVVGNLLPHLTRDLVKDLPLAFIVAIVYQIARLQN